MMKQPGAKKVVEPATPAADWPVAKHMPGYIMQRTTACIHYCTRLCMLPSVVRRHVRFSLRL